MLLCALSGNDAFSWPELGGWSAGQAPLQTEKHSTRYNQALVASQLASFMPENEMTIM